MLTTLPQIICIICEKVVTGVMYFMWWGGLISYSFTVIDTYLMETRLRESCDFVCASEYQIVSGYSPSQTVCIIHPHLSSSLTHPIKFF